MKSIFRANIFLKLFGFFKIPLIFYVNPNIISLSEKEIRVKIRLRRRTKNHYGTMYFGAIAVGADISTGLFAMHIIEKRGVKMDLLFKDFKINFLKRPAGDVVFVCDEYKKINEQIDEVIKRKVRINKTVKGYAVVPSIDSYNKVCEFELTISLKQSFS